MDFHRSFHRFPSCSAHDIPKIYIHMTVDVSESRALDVCDFTAWGISGPLAAYTIPAVSIPLPRAFTSFLVADGVFASDTNRALPTADHDQWSDSDASSSSSCSSSSSSGWGSEANGDWFSAHPTLKLALESAITRLGGRVFPKLNWSAPTDVLWLTSTGSLDCTHPDEIALLLKGSDRIAHDVTLLHRPIRPLGAPIIDHDNLDENNDNPRLPNQDQSANFRSATALTISASSPASPPSPRPRSNRGAHADADVGVDVSVPESRACLVLKKFIPDLADDPGREFRAFVRRGRLVGVSQRQAHVPCPHLADAEEIRRIRRGIKRLAEVVVPHVPLAEFVFDAILRHRKDWEDDDKEEEEEGEEGDADLTEDEDHREVDVRRHWSPSQLPMLVDINPWRATTQPLLFEWDELEREDHDDDVTIVTSSASASASPCRPKTLVPVPVKVNTDQSRAVQPGARLAMGLPFDFVDETVQGNVVDLIQRMRAAERAREGEAGHGEEGRE